MRTNGSQDRPQTIKQAKAAFKARGATAVSAVERRRLERGAQLLERATRIKEQEQRKKELLTKKDVKAPQDQSTRKSTVLLGTQFRLDKFGYKSSQLHLGAFLKAARPSVRTERETSPVLPLSPEPWDNADVDDDTLLDIANESPYSHVKSKQETRETTGQSAGQATLIPSPVQEPNDPSSPSTEDFEQWDDFLESSTQIARELSSEKSVPQINAVNHFSSFDSADFDFSEVDVEDLEKQAASKCGSVDSSAPPQKPAFDNNNVDRQRMPPPTLPLFKHRPSPEASTLQHATRDNATSISLTDLESLAEEDIEFSQFPAG